jgi:glycosyltransferase involved in cell wall biosynthesis
MRGISTDKKKLCLLIHSLQAGGMERVMSELARYFCQKEGIEVHIVLYGRRPEIFYNIPNNLVVHRPDFEFNNKFRRIATIRRLLFLRKTVCSIKPDSLLSFGEYWNSFVLLALLGLPYPVFISDRCSPKKKFGTLHTLLRRILYPRAKGVIAQTEKAKKLYTSQFKHNNIYVIGNPIRQPVAKSSGIERENIVLTVGRLIQSKHHDKLIELFAGLSFPGWKLVIVGDDALKQCNSIKLKELVQKLNAEDRVILTGKQTDVESYYLRSKIFAFTSSSEGFPNVIGEAMSAGIPVIAFDCVAGPSEMIEDGVTGYLISLFDYDTFKERLISLMLDEHLRQALGFNSQKKIAEFSSEIIGEKYFKSCVLDN